MICSVVIILRFILIHIKSFCQINDLLIIINIHIFYKYYKRLINNTDDLKQAQVYNKISYYENKYTERMCSSQCTKLIYIG